MQNITTPRQVQRCAAVGLAICLPTGAAILAAWAVGVFLPHRPHLVVMLFAAILGGAMVSVMLWAGAVMHVAVAQAFAAGVAVGSGSSAHPSVRVPVQREPARPELHVVT